MKTSLLFLGISFLAAVSAQRPRAQYAAVCPSKHNTVEVIGGRNIRYICDSNAPSNTQHKSTKTDTLAKCKELCGDDNGCAASSWRWATQVCEFTNYQKEDYITAPGLVMMVQEDKKTKLCEECEKALSDCQDREKEVAHKLDICRDDLDVCDESKNKAEADKTVLQNRVDSLTAKVAQCKNDNPLYRKTADCPADDWQTRWVKKWAWLIRCSHSNTYKAFKQINDTKNLYHCIELCANDTSCAAVDRDKTGACMLKNKGRDGSYLNPNPD